MLRITYTAVVLLLLSLANQTSCGSGLSSGTGSDTSKDNIDAYDGYFDEGDLEGFEDFQDELDQSDSDEDDIESDQRELKGARVLRHRTRNRNIDSLHGSRDLRSKGKGKGGSGSRSYSRSFLDPDIEPRPFINCIPLPPSRSSRNSKGMMSGGKGKGKGNRRRSRKRRSSSSRRNLKGKGKGSSSSSSSSNSRSFNGRMGGGRGMRKQKLPYCPLPTFEPTFLPTVTPFPTFTPLPTVTPFPSFTPFPTIVDQSGPSTAPSLAPTIAPSVSSQPSLRPSVSDRPSVSKQPSVSPSSFSAGPTTRNVSARLGYGFFDTATIRQPTTEEINGLLVQTELFYSDLLRAAYPTTFTSFTMSNILETYDPTGALPVILDFDASVVFSADSNGSPTAAQVFAVMEAANYESYITGYVWASTPVGTSLFFDTQRVAFAARGGTVV